MPSIKSTYNFISAPEEGDVLKPKWSHLVSHDIPFSDGESGEISISITAQTPIFIRNGYAEGKEKIEFSHVGVGSEKRYFIPATSLKGMTRSVMEIITHSRMNRVNDHRHAVRQIMKTKGTVVDEGYELSGVEKGNIKAGWLLQKEGKYFIISCGRPYKIRNTDVDELLGVSFQDQFGPKNNSQMDTNFSARTAKYKYEKLISGKKLELYFEDHPLDEEGQSSWVSKFQPLPYVQPSDKDIGGFPGTIVCVGQASHYGVSTSRRGEYVFKGLRSEKIKSENKILVPTEIIETFLFINRHNQADELEDWGYWKDKLAMGVPVFYREATTITKTEEGKERRVKSVKDFGLSFMYKQPAKFSVKQSYPLVSYPDQEAENYQPDWTETIFGFTAKKKKLKGRVFFSNLFQEEAITPLKERTVVLSTPRSSFFPFYLKQTKGKNGKTILYNTYNNNPILAGFKRYPVRNSIKLMDTSEMNQKMITAFRPLPTNATFKGKVRFHNLKKAEIGALLSALTFHGNQEKYFHSLGYAKGLGYGKIRINIDSPRLKYSMEEYLKSFEYEMTKKNTNWYEGDTLKELLAIASNPNEEVQRQLEYMEIKDFQEVKNIGLYLEPYSKISQKSPSLSELLGNKEREELMAIDRKQAEKEKQLLQAQKEKLIAEQQEKEAAEYQKAIDISTLTALEDFLIKHPNSRFKNRIEEVKQKIRTEKKKATITAALNDVIPDNIVKFEEIKKWANSKMKLKNFSFSTEQKAELTKVIKQLFVEERKFVKEGKKTKKSTFHKKSKLNTFNKFPWTDIKNWLGIDDGFTLYKDLTGNQK